MLSCHKRPFESQSMDCKSGGKRAHCDHPLEASRSQKSLNWPLSLIPPCVCFIISWLVLGHRSQKKVFSWLVDFPMANLIKQSHRISTCAACTASGRKPPKKMGIALLFSSGALPRAHGVGLRQGRQSDGTAQNMWLPGSLSTFRSTKSYGLQPFSWKSYHFQASPALSNNFM